jgi:hypothetical protein
LGKFLQTWPKTGIKNKNPKESLGILAGTKNRVLEMDIPETGKCNLVGLDVASAAAVAAVVVKLLPLLFFLGGMMWVLVGKTTHKNCVSGPLFACLVSPLAATCLFWKN